MSCAYVYVRLCEFADWGLWLESTFGREKFFQNP